MYLENKIAIVTGANRGVGKATSLLFAREGATVILIGRRLEALEKVRKEIEEKGGKAKAYVCDLLDDDQIFSTVDMIKKDFGKIEILVNNAGISKEKKLLDLSYDEWDEIMNMNLRAPMVMMKAVLPIMLEQKKGSIVNVASAAAIRGLPGSCAYSASKAGLKQMSEAVGDEVKRTGVRINVICPGPIDTEMFQKSERREFILKAGGDVFKPEVIANGILFLACDELSEVTNSQTLIMRGFNRW